MHRRISKKTSRCNRRKNIILTTLGILLLLGTLGFSEHVAQAVGEGWARISGSSRTTPARTLGAVSTTPMVLLHSGAPVAPKPMAATIVVNTTNQEVTNDGDCSLQEAIFSANYDTNKAIDPSNLNGPRITTGCTPGSGDDTIVLAAGATYQVSGIVQDQFNVPGLDANPRVFSTITIEGNGAKLERVGDQNLRAFTVSSGVETIDATTMPTTDVTGTGNLTIRDLHIKGFRTKGGDGGTGGAAGGGGLGAGGAIYVNAGAGSLGPVVGTPSLTIERCTFEDNAATGGNGGVGTGISATEGGGGGGGIGGKGGNGSPGGTELGGGAGGGSRGNGGAGQKAGGGGGGTANDGVVGFNVGGVPDPGNGALGGNGGFNCGGKGGSVQPQVPPASKDGGNGFCAGGGGGGGAQGGLVESFVGGNGGAGNYAGGGGGGGASQANGGAGGFGGGGGGSGLNNGVAGAGGFGGGGGGAGPSGGIGGFFGGNGTTSANNSHGGGGAALGGAIFNDRGSVTILNSTFFNNSVVAGLAGGTGATAGKANAAVFSRNGTLRVFNSTFSNNLTNSTGFVGSDIFVLGDGTTANFEFRNNIMANPPASIPDCLRQGVAGGGTSGAITSNLVEQNGDGSCSGSPGPDPALGPLTLNAPGKTPTMAITQFSPAFDNGSNTFCLATDQRGVARPQFVACDIGAYEVAPNALADLGVSKTAVSVVDPDGAGPLAPVPLPIVGPNVPPGSVNAGGYIRYDVPFGNAGPQDAVNVRLTDVVPGNTAFVGALATGGVFVPAAQPPAVPFNFTIIANLTTLNCTVTGAAGNQQITCAPSTPLSALPAGSTGTLTFFVRVNESVPGGTIVANPANITSAPSGTTPASDDPNPGNNTSLPTSTVVVASSNLSITKIVQSAVTVASNPNQTGPIGPATAPNGAGLTGTAVVPGTLLTYRLIITNGGPSDVSNIRVTDVLPSGLETPPGRVLGARFVSATPVLPSGATFTCGAPTGVPPNNNPQGNGGSVVCTAPLLSANAPNNVAAIDVTVFIDPATKANLVDTATVDATLNNFNRPIAGTTVLTTPVTPRADLALTKRHTPDPVVAGGEVNYTITLTNNGPSTAASVSLVDTFPPFQKLTAVEIQQTPDQSGAPRFSCTAVPAIGAPGNTTSLTCTAAELPPNRNANGSNNPSGTVRFILTVVQDANTPNSLPVPYQNCVTVTSSAVDPIGSNSTSVCDQVNVLFRSGPPTDQQATSVLIFPIYISDAASPHRENTRMSVTNVSTKDSACVHLFNLEGVSCSPADLFLCLSPNQTMTFLASDLDPGNRGFSMAVAVDCATGLPSGSNALIGEEFVKFSSGHAANLLAWGVPAVTQSPAGTDPNVETAVLRFDGLAYNRLPRILMVDSIGSPADRDSTLLIVDRIGGDMTESGLLIGNIFGWLYSDVEIGYSFTARYLTCQLRETLTSAFPRTTPSINTIIPEKHTGWMKFWSTADGALIGSQINFNRDWASVSRAFNQGHNLHVLTTTSSATLTIPVVRPFC